MNLSDRKERTKALRSKFDIAFNKYISNHNLGDLDLVLFSVYTLMYGEAPNKISMYGYKSYMKERFLDSANCHKCVNGEDKEDEKIYENIIYPNTVIKCKDYLENKTMIPYFTMRYDCFHIIVTDNKEIVFNMYGDSIYILSSKQTIPDWFEENLVLCDDDVHTYEYLIYDKDGFNTMSMSIKNLDVDIKTNYNDDLPYDKIVDFLNSDESGLVIMRGKPGTGKSALIRHLITTVDRDFLYLDQSSFDSICDASFIRTLADYENAVIILEDCEDILTGRMNGNSKIAALLNIADGILGDTFKFKIICTFNADIGKIDTALRRKGRLKVDYKFTELSEDKVNALTSKLGITLKEKDKNKKLVLTDIYNYLDDGGDEQETKTFGFNL